MTCFFPGDQFFMFLAHQVKYLVTLDPWLQTGHTDLKIKRSLGFQCPKYYETGHNYEAHSSKLSMLSVYLIEFFAMF